MNPLSNSNERLSFLKKKGMDAGSTFIPAQELSKLQSGLVQTSKNIQEHYLTLWFPELRGGKTFEQMTDWLFRNGFSFSCVAMTKPDPNKMLNRLEYVCYREKPTEVKLAFYIFHEIKPLPTGGFSASCTHEAAPWPKDLVLVKG